MQTASEAKSHQLTDVVVWKWNWLFATKPTSAMDLVQVYPKWPKIAGWSTGKQQLHLITYWPKHSYVTAMKLTEGTNEIQTSQLPIQWSI